MANYKYFRYFNPNPSLKEKGDCIIRALCAACDKDWITVYDSVVYMARKQYTMPDDMDIVKQFLEEEGFVPYKVTVKKGSRRPTMQKLIREYPGKTIVGQCASHIMCAKNGKVMDLWDSSDRPLYRYWVKP